MFRATGDVRDIDCFEILEAASSKLIVAAFVAASPVMIERAITEYTLMGHWLILWGIYLYFTERRGGFDGFGRLWPLWR